MSHEKKRKLSTPELIKDLRLYNHHASAERMEQLDAEVRTLQEANTELKRILSCYGHDGKPIFADRS